MPRRLSLAIIALLTIGPTPLVAQAAPLPPLKGGQTGPLLRVLDASGASLLVVTPANVVTNGRGQRLGVMSHGVIVPDAVVKQASQAPAVLTAISTKTAAYTTVATDSTLLLDTTSGTFALTLLSAATAGAGHSYTLKWKAGTTAPTVSGTVDGGTLTFTALNQSRTITSDGTSWYVTAGYL